MRKTDKKIDNQLREALTKVCEFALQDIAGYQSINHTVNYNNFPDSLSITCIFDNKKNADAAQRQNELIEFINQKLNDIAIKLKKPHKQIHFKCK